MRWSVRQIATLLGVESDCDVIPRAIQFDSRQVKKNDLFFAFKGDQVDGHDYVEEAYERGGDRCHR